MSSYDSVLLMVVVVVGLFVMGLFLGVKNFDWDWNAAIIRLMSRSLKMGSWRKSRILERYEYFVFRERVSIS